MEKSEALLLLPIPDGGSIEEAYEQKLFEWKNFFVHRFPISKLFRKKIHQIQRLQEAYVELGGSKIKSIQGAPEIVPFDSSLKQSFQRYHSERNQLKMQLYASQSALELIVTVEGLLQITSEYAKRWSNNELDTSGIIVSKEVDPMDLLSAIHDAETQGVTTITDIGKLSDGHMVLNEAKRLSLWSKMEKA